MKLEINPREFWSAAACRRIESGDMSPHSKGAFTLVELLVVVSIIVVLLSLLAPALDQAIYNAELAVCGSRLDAVGGGVMLYAGEYRRFYPHRVLAQRGLMRPVDIQYYWPSALPARVDDRPILGRAMSLNKALNCPLSPRQVDLEGSLDNCNVITNYGLWFDFGFQGENRMTKIGDTVRWLGDEFKVLAGDWAANFDNSNETGPHSDGQTMVPYVFQDQDIFTGASTPAYGYTLSLWTTQAAGVRKPLDFNFVFNDGSVNLYRGVAWNAGAPGQTDERIAQVPQWDIPSNQPIAKVQMPLR